MPLTTRVFSPSLWPDLERLFGANGACGGCWCIYWRQELGTKWEAMKGEPNRRRLRALAKRGDLHGVLAFEGDEPVGWCAFGPRRDFVKLDRAPSFRCDDAGRVWSIPCFYVPARHRGKGVGTALLRAAVSELRKRRAPIVEAYPVRPSGKPIPGAFAWTGTLPMFEKAGFGIAGNRKGGKVRVRLLDRGARR
jgi:GNAT superfamily N-acetyltransferase